jgi:cyclopropane fatty-acyl-phospholipid synthase-like methyltransferase
MGFAASVGQQFGRPIGPLGRVAGWIMAWRPSNRERSHRTVDLLKLQPDDHVLEIGCGPGVAIGFAAMLTPRGRVVGLDHSALMCEQAAARNAHLIDSGRVQIECGGFERLSTLGERFDKAFAINVFQFLPEHEATPQFHCECAGPPASGPLPDRPEALRLIRAVLKPGGRLALNYMPRHPGAQAADTERFAGVLMRELAAAGYREPRAHTMLFEPIPAVCVIARA